VERLFADRTVGRETFLDRALAFDRAVYLPDDLLVKEDRMSMAVSVEGRVPFLDNELVGFADALPSSAKVRRGTSKALLKRAARGVLPDEVIDRPKHGFGVPISEWLRGDLAAAGRELLRSLTARNLLEVEAVPALWERHQRGEAELGPAIWGLMMLELWHREHVG
jgi:asparagine synthase (glutamine-hydrolysing)